MKTYARIDNGKIFELLETGGDISQMFHPDLLWVAVPDGISPLAGWVATQKGKGWDFSAPLTPSRTLEEIKALIASERYQRESTGIVVDGLQIETTRDSQSLIASTGLSAVLDAEYRCHFKTGAGFVEIDAEQILSIAKAVRAHVQACFDREDTLLRLLEADEFNDEMLNQGWPVSETVSAAAS
ncbi:DUF4376 domain-containing protein [Pseudomonas alliivorans]|nr:DUF4376 domain-containing protein [Pseudomonas alliivorans]